MKIKKYFTKFLIIYSDLINGMGSLSLFPNEPIQYKVNKRSPFEQDYLAISNDWKNVGDNLRIAMKNYENSLSNRNYQRLLNNRLHKRLLLNKLNQRGLDKIIRN